MPCQHVKLPGGASAIVCGPRQRLAMCECGRPAPLLCDWKTPTARNKRKTCDEPICETCTTRPAPDKDLCRKHAAEFEAWKAERTGR